MRRRQLDDSWKHWLRENIERQCDPGELFCILVENHFSLEAIKAAMGDHDPTRLPPATVASNTPSDIDYRAIAETRLTHPDKCPQAKRFPSDLVQLYTIDDFLSHQECDAISEIICRNLCPSTITGAASEPDKQFRTSSSSYLGLLNNELIEAVEEKIARTLGIRPSYSEGLQGHHYSIGQEFKKHTDFFEPDTEEYAEHGAEQGNRTWTFMVYLNDVPKGGGTHFINLAHIFQPKKGQAVIWNNLHDNGMPNYNVLHAGMPVEEGCKIIITKWFREHGSGPMFYPD
jgi:prolyl 4-hydroxylase